MKARDALLTLAELSASQWGMFTTAQAATRDVSRLTLARLADAGQLERLAHGVYRDAGSPGDELDDLRALWLSVDPARLAEERITTDEHAVIVSGATAAWLHGVGDLRPEPYEFTTSRRRQSHRDELRYRVRKLDGSRITIIHGLPVTDLEQTIVDLVEARTDLSLVAGVTAAAADKRPLDRRLLAKLLAPLAARNGFAAEDGQAVLAHLEKLAGSDTDALAASVAPTPVGQLATARLLEQISTLFPVIQRVHDAVGESGKPSTALVAESLRHEGMPVNSQLVETVRALSAHSEQLLPALPALNALSENLARTVREEIDHEGDEH